jgi:hypothetical protein
MPDDPLIQKTEEVADKASQQRFADLFDVRRVIGGLFAVYGAILLIASLFASDEDVERAQGINANLWVGLALLATAAIFFVWALRAPVGAQLVGRRRAASTRRRCPGRRPRRRPPPSARPSGNAAGAAHSARTPRPRARELPGLRAARAASPSRGSRGRGTVAP